MDKAKMALYDYIILIDKSGSMTTPDCAGGVSRWKMAQEYATSIAHKCEEFDDDGIEIIMFSGKPTAFKNTTAAKVAEIFASVEPSGSTDTAAALQLVFDGYNTRKAAGEAKPMIIVVITDGAPTDRDAVDKAITNFANSMTEDGECGIQFVQIGKDPEARKFLEHLDNDLQALGAKFDIVDTKNQDEMEEISITDLLLAAVND